MVNANSGYDSLPESIVFENTSKIFEKHCKHDKSSWKVKERKVFTWSTLEELLNMHNFFYFIQSLSEYISTKVIAKEIQNVTVFPLSLLK